MELYLNTLQYYCRWLDINLTDLKNHKKICKLSAERNKKQLGYDRAFEMYCFIMDNQIVFSYSDKLSDKIHSLTTSINLDDLKSTVNNMEKTLEKKIKHTMKFYFTKINKDIDLSETIQLQENDYDDYLTFFKSKNPQIRDTCWVKDYYSDMVKNGYCWGIKENDKFVSVTDSPDVPYMRDLIVELGINTLNEYQNKGYAKKVCTALIEHILNKGKVPIWSCSSSNLASIKLAENIGFKKIGDVLTVL